MQQSTSNTQPRYDGPKDWTKSRLTTANSGKLPPDRAP
jgi:hypothetical protein